MEEFVLLTTPSLSSSLPDPSGDDSTPSVNIMSNEYWHGSFKGPLGDKQAAVPLAI